MQGMESNAYLIAMTENGDALYVSSSQPLTAETAWDIGAVYVAQLGGTQAVDSVTQAVAENVPDPN